jgi:hypothetical protein
LRGAWFAAKVRAAGWRDIDWLLLGFVDCNRFGFSPLVEEVFQFRRAVGSVFAKFDDVLRVEKGPVAFEYEEVRYSEDMRI